jgi:hypothetical protein
MLAATGVGMADYYHLVARAVAGLEQNTGDVRRALYERARAALVQQLREVTPPLQEREITRERLALEEAFRRIEKQASASDRPHRLSTRVQPSPDPLAELARLIGQQDPDASLAQPAPPPRSKPAPKAGSSVQQPAFGATASSAPASVFLSYARADAEKVDKIVTTLKAAGHRVWIDRSGIDGGQDWRTAIVGAIDSAEIFVIALSTTSIISKMVIRELSYADETHKPIIPILLHNVKLPPTMTLQLSGLQRIDCSQDLSAGAQELVATMRKRFGADR